APRPDRQPGPAAGHAGPGLTGRTRHDPPDRPGDQADPRRPDLPAPAPRTRHPLGRLDPPPPGTSTLVPPARTPKARLRPGQLAKCGCRTSEAPPLTAEISGSAGASLRVSSSWPSKGRSL